MKFHLILTIDYELFGDGSGCIENCILKPTASCLQALDEFQVPLSFFVDATEFISIREAYSSTVYRSYPKVERQLIEACQSIHNLQLHLHPQFKDATLSDNRWSLDLCKWRIGSLSHDEVTDLVETGLKFLGPLTGSAERGRNLKVFRAGGWSIQPSSKVLSVLKRNGIEMDTTVAPNTVNPARGDWYNFLKAPKSPYWYVHDDVCKEEDHPTNFAEVPIATERVGVMKRARSLTRHRSQPGLPEGCTGGCAGPNSKWQVLREKTSKLLRLGMTMLDYSTLPAWLLIEVTRAYMQRFANHEGPVPIVAIGHNKNFSSISRRNLQAWIEWASKEPNIGFSDFAKWKAKL